MDEKEKSIGKVIRLAAKTGLYFAHVDGVYDAREKKLIGKFIDKLGKFGPVDEVKSLVNEPVDPNITLSELAAETRDALAPFSKVEQAAIMLTLEEFVEDVIGADYVANKAERKAFSAWKKALE